MRTRAKAKPGRSGQGRGKDVQQNGVKRTKAVQLKSGKNKRPGRLSKHSSQQEAPVVESPALDEAAEPAGSADGGRGPRRRSSTAAAPAASKESLASISDEALQEVFAVLAKDCVSFCREVLPMVCKRFRDVLRQPSGVWQTVHLDFIQKGQHLEMPALLGPSQEGPTDGGANQRLLRTAVERWFKPRAPAVRRLIVSFSARDPSHSFSKLGHGLQRLLQTGAPSLQQLLVAGCSDIFHGPSFADLAPLQRLETLAITFCTGRIRETHLAHLEHCKQLRSLTISANRMQEEANGPCLSGFPETLLRLKGLTSLALGSTGITSISAGITRLKALEVLDLSNCGISFLPSQLSKCTTLRHVRLNSTSMLLGVRQTWEPLARLPGLESLELRDVKASHLPSQGVSGFEALTSLDLSFNLFENVAPQGLGVDHTSDGQYLTFLGMLSSLQRLSLRCSQLCMVPSSLWGLKALTHLDLSRNQLVDLPDELTSLPALRELLAEANSFPRLPEVLTYLPALEVADLSFCIYMEACASLDQRAELGFRRLKRLDLRKMIGVWKQSSVGWLKKFAAAMAVQGKPGAVVWE